MATFEVMMDVDAVLDFTIDWSDCFPSDDPIVASTWTTDDEITIGSDGFAPSFTDTTATVWLSGGESGCAYEVTNHVETGSGREDDRTIKVYVYEA